MAADLLRTHLALHSCAAASGVVNQTSSPVASAKDDGHAGSLRVANTWTSASAYPAPAVRNHMRRVCASSGAVMLRRSGGILGE